MFPRDRARRDLDPTSALRLLLAKRSTQGEAASYQGALRSPPRGKRSATCGCRSRALVQTCRDQRCNIRRTERNRRITGRHSSTFIETISTTPRWKRTQQVMGTRAEDREAARRLHCCMRACPGTPHPGCRRRALRPGRGQRRSGSMNHNGHTRRTCPKRSCRTACRPLLGGCMCRSRNRNGRYWRCIRPLHRRAGPRPREKYKYRRAGCC